MVGAPVKLGPFVKGINNVSDPSMIDDSELVDCVNFESDLDGSLICRPPIIETVDNSGVWSERIVIIGSGVFPEGNFIIGSNAQGTYAFNGTSWSLIVNNLTSRCAIQFFNKMWIIAAPGESASGGSWDPTGGFAANAAQPQGEKAVAYKGRLFICPGQSATVNPSRLYFSDVVTSIVVTWGSGANFLDISPGDGQKLMTLAVYNDFLVLFKNDSTHVLAYDSLISDAQRQVVSNTIGVSGENCMAQYENSVYVYHEGFIYEMKDLGYNRASERLQFEFDTTSVGGTRVEKYFLSIVGDRLVFKFYNRIYVLQLRVGSWSRWVSDGPQHNFGPIVEMPGSTSIKKYYMGSAASPVTKVYVVQDRADLTAETSDIVCSLKTKNYDLSESQHFKKLAWWGADVLATRNVVGRANPVTITFTPTWADMRNYTWGSRHTFTWGNPLQEPQPIETAVVASGIGIRKFCKFPRALRFRQINFEIELTNDGSTLEGPVRFFTFTAIVSSRATVGKQVN